jgi:hypothetical protein
MMATRALVLLLLVGCVDITGAPRDDDDATDDDDAVDPLIDRLREALQSGDGPAIERLWHEAALGGGVPVEDSGRWLFLTPWPDAPGAVALVGDINGWVPQAAAGPVAGEWYWLEPAEAEFELPAAGAKYKWNAADVYRAPPETTAYGFDENGRHGWVRPPTAAPWMEQFPLASEHLESPRALRAWLPAGFELGSVAAAGFRTLLMHDGQNVMHPDAPWGGWAVDETLASRGYTDVVLLAIDNAPDRLAAYTHVPDDLGEGLIGGRADDHSNLVELEALPFLRARYGVPARGPSLMVAGSSLGGLFALYSAATTPDLQGCIAALSPTLGWGAFGVDGSQAFANSWPTDVGHGSVSIYLDSGGDVVGTCVDGDGDGIFEDADASDNFCTTAQLRDVLEGLGYEFGVDLGHWHEPGAPHNEAAWRDRFWRALAHCDDTAWRAP